METTRSSFCRCCLNRCAIWVTVEDGRATKVTGDRDDPLYGGYTCVKGRSQPQFLYGDDRLLTSLKRLPDGPFAPIPAEQAMDEIAERLLAIRALISWNGNPVVAFPDQLKTVAALKSLELLVQIDTRLTATAELADYVIAPTMPLEVPSSTGA